MYNTDDRQRSESETHAATEGKHRDPKGSAFATEHAGGRHGLRVKRR
jgi:hypothetical protein